MDLLNSPFRVIEFPVDKNEDGYTAGDFLRLRGVSRRLLTKLKKMPDGILCGGNHIRTIDIVHTGDIVSVSMTDSKGLDGNPLLKVPVVYEDDDVVVFNKPIDMPVHPSIKHQGDTLGNCFAAMFPELTFRPVNRLDKDTSGLCAVAKNAHAANMLQGTLDKTYFAVVSGVLSENGRIDAPIGRVGDSIILREVRDDGQPSVTDYTILKCNHKYTLVRVKLLTGRTHQIRVHFAYIGHALAGDNMYGGDCSDICNQALHCGELSFVHPVTKEFVTLSSDLRDDMLQILQ